MTRFGDAPQEHLDIDTAPVGVARHELFATHLVVALGLGGATAALIVGILNIFIHLIGGITWSILLIGLAGLTMTGVLQARSLIRIIRLRSPTNNMRPNA